MDIPQAATSLREKLGRPPWLSAIGVAEKRCEIVIYSAVSLKETMRELPFLHWEGYTIKVVEFGSFAPLGGVL